MCRFFKLNVSVGSSACASGTRRRGSQDGKRMYAGHTYYIIGGGGVGYSAVNRLDLDSLTLYLASGNV